MAMGLTRFQEDDCITCQGTKRFLWYADESRTEIVEYECNCNDQMQMHRRFLWCGIGTMYQRYAWADIVEHNEATDGARAYIELARQIIPTGTGLMLHGQSGTGKTLLATLVLKEIMAQGPEGYFTTFSNLIEMFASGWKKPEEQEWFHKLVRNIPILCVDDIGKERRTGAADSMSLAESVADDLLRWRCANALPTIITTEHDPDDENFELRYGVSVMSLLRSSSYFYRFEGTNFRKTSMRGRYTDEITNQLTRPVVVG